MARLINDLVQLRNELNAAYPKRDKKSDGWIGDAAHQATKSDHNPDKNGVVHAIDIDKDGIGDPYRLVAIFIKHPSVEYVIYNRKIWSRSYGFKARAYTGSNAHTEHIHVSSRYGSAYDDGKPAWNVKPPVKPPVVTKPPVKAPAGIPSVKNGTRVLENKSPDMKGTDVIFVQKFIGSKRAGAADGVYGSKTESAVRWYQQMRGIKVDGEVGPQTWRQMGVTWRG